MSKLVNNIEFIIKCDKYEDKSTRLVNGTAIVDIKFDMENECEYHFLLRNKKTGDIVTCNQLFNPDFNDDCDLRSNKLKYRSAMQFPNDNKLTVNKYDLRENSRQLCDKLLIDKENGVEVDSITILYDYSYKRNKNRILTDFDPYIGDKDVKYSDDLYIYLEGIKSITTECSVVAFCENCNYVSDELVIFNEKAICYECYEERTCESCLTIEKNAFTNFFICEVCNKRILSDRSCSCLAICWCQSEECICTSCIDDSEYSVKCEKCKKRINSELELSQFPIVIDGDGNELLCEKCK